MRAILLCDNTVDFIGFVTDWEGVFNFVSDIFGCCWISLILHFLLSSDSLFAVCSLRINYSKKIYSFEFLFWKKDWIFVCDKNGFICL